MSKRVNAADMPAFDTLFFSRVSTFLNKYLTKQAGRSDHTRDSYKAGLGSFYDYVTEKLNIPAAGFQFSQCTYEFLLEYMQYLQMELKLKASTVNSRLAAIRSYLKYAADCDVSVSPVYMTVCRVPSLTVPEVQMPLIETNDMAAFLDSPGHSKMGNRDRFILILLYDSAIRVSELVGITLGDIIRDADNYSILVHGKGRKERCITLSLKASQHMKSYLSAYHGDNTDAFRPLFYTTTHGHISAMSDRNVERIVQKYGDISRQTNSGIPESVSPHTLRRSRATALYRDGVPLEQVSTLLGHSQIETTRSHYAFPSPEQLKETVEKGSAQEPPQSAEWVGHTEDIKKKFGL